MAHLAQPAIIFLNAPETPDPRCYGKASGKMRCLFPALNQATCADLGYWPGDNRGT
jgi:hypothetical protein